jgi:hypothetical protein
MIGNPGGGFNLGAEFAEVMVRAIGPDDPDGPPAVPLDRGQLGPAGVAQRLACFQVTTRASYHFFDIQSI